MFRKELIAHVGIKRCQIIFCEQTGYQTSRLYLWKAQGSVPRAAFDQIADIEIGLCDSDRFKGFHTQRFFNRVVELSNANVPIKRIAATLTTEMGRKVTDGAVKSARFRMKDKITAYRTRGA
jgi:hypothetical protein